VRGEGPFASLRVTAARGEREQRAAYELRPTTYDLRPTTDDRRPTTDDRRPTTDDL